MTRGSRVQISPPLAWKHDIPLPASKGCVAINNESLGGWNIYGPALYLSTRLAYDPKANANELLNDYCLARVNIAADGLKNAAQYRQTYDAMNRGDFAAARKVYDELLSRAQAAAQAGYGMEYTVNYLTRFIGKLVINGAERVLPP